MSGLYTRKLSDLKNMQGVKMIALGSRDGFIIGEKEDREIETMAIMSAEMIRAAESATNKLERSGPMHVVVDYGQGKLISASVGPKALISVMVEQNASIDSIMGEIDRTAGKIREIL